MLRETTQTPTRSTRDTNTRRWVWVLAVIIVTLLALGLRWYYVSTAWVINPIRADAAQYYAHAWNLVLHGVFSGSKPGAATVIADNYRDPGYPLLLAFWMKIFSNQALWYAAVLLSQAVLGALTVTWAMLLGRRWLDWRWATAAGVLIAVWPHNIAIASNLLSETLFGFLCALAMLLAARASDRSSTGWAVVAGLAFGAAALTNAILLPFGVLLALYLAWRRLVPRRVWIGLLVGALLLPGGWAIRNAQLPAQSGAQTSTDRALQNLVQGSWPTYHAAYALLAHGDQRGAPTFRAIDHEYQLLRHSPGAGARAILHRMAQHPLRYLAWYTLEKPAALWGWSIAVGQNDIYVYAVRYSPFDSNPVMRALAAVCHTINPLLAVLALGCVVIVLVRHRRPLPHSAHGKVALESVLLLLVYVTVVYSILQTDPRYAIAFRAFEILLAMTSCAVLIKRILEFRHERAAVAQPDTKSRHAQG